MMSKTFSFYIFFIELSQRFEILELQKYLKIGFDKQLYFFKLKKLSQRAQQGSCCFKIMMKNNLFLNLEVKMNEKILG